MTLQLTDKLQREISVDVDGLTINHVKRKWVWKVNENKYSIKALDFISFSSSFSSTLENLTRTLFDIF